MTWSYRVVRRQYPHGEELGIYSVYYNDAGEVEGISLDPAPVNSHSVEDLENELDLMRKALHEPVLDYEDESH